MNDLIKADFYKADVFRFDLEKNQDSVDLEICNAISWDVMRFKMSREELKGLADFINKFLET
ncbi:hypothetical protein EB001_13425 [bacterium]|nr:hypothetical protein [bacterium]